MNSTRHTIFVRGILRTHWLRVCWGYVLPVITCIALVAACWCNGCSILQDMDGDSVADAIDNCPATANANQADSDVNGVGDACQGEGLATGDSLGYSTTEGVAEASFDQRLRSVQMACPGQLATLVWPNDSSQVDIELVSNAVRTTSSTPMDFSDAALLAALDAAEAEGADVAAYRQYVADYPGRIQQIVTGQQPPSSASTQGRLGQQPQNLNPTVARYLLKLTEAVLICNATGFAILDQFSQIQDPQLRDHLYKLAQSFFRLAREIEHLYEFQHDYCLVCSDHCNVQCADYHACCIYNYPENRVDCVDTYERESCEMDWFGKFDENYSCKEINNCDKGACCIDQDDVNPGPPNFDLQPQCGDHYPRQVCEQMNNQSFAPGESIVYTKYHVGKECSEIICEE